MFIRRNRTSSWLRQSCSLSRLQKSSAQVFSFPLMNYHISSFTLWFMHRMCNDDLLVNEIILFDPCVLISVKFPDDIFPCSSRAFLIVLFLPSHPCPPCFFLFLSLSQCQQYREQASVLENQSTGTFVLQVHAVDADEGANGKVKYGLMHRDSAMAAFRINPETGCVVMHCLVFNRSHIEFCL